MKITEMKKRDFKTLKYRQWNEDIGLFDSLVIIPRHQLHDSGYRCMEFVAARKDVPICKLSGGSDVIHIDGIGGYGKWMPPSLPYSVPPKGWSIDCLPKSGYLRLFMAGALEAGRDLSSFEIFGHYKGVIK